MSLQFTWCDNAKLLKLKSVKLKKNQEKNFVKSSLFLNNISYDKSNQIYLFYIKEIETYQIMVFDKNFKSAYIECFEHYDKIEKENILFIHSKYFVLYKNKQAYYFQNLKYDITKEELKDYIKNNLDIDVNYVVEINDEDLAQLIKKYEERKKKSKLVNVNKAKDNFLKIYVLYIVLIIFALMYFLNILPMQKFSQPTFKTLSKVIPYTNFYPFDDKYKKILTHTKKYKLKIINLSYQNKIVNLKLQAENKKNLYDFLEQYEDKIVNKDFSIVKYKKIFIGEVGLKI